MSLQMAAGVLALLMINRWIFIAVFFCLVPCFAFGAITVNGVTDKVIRTNSATFDVPSVAGFVIDARLDGLTVALDSAHVLTKPGYYELAVTKSADVGGAEESVLIRFIVLDSSRGTSERGSVNWVPYPTIDSAPSAFASGTLDVIMPIAVPAGMPIPLVAWLRDGADKAIRLNGSLNAGGAKIRILRGVGSGFLPGVNVAGPLEVEPEVNGLTDAQTIQIEAAPVWTNVNSDITTATNWAANSRVHVTGDFAVASGATLTIEAGCIVQLSPDVQINVDGSLVINGTRSAPVLFAPVPGMAAWGGFFVRTSGASVTASGAIFTGSGGDANWFSGTAFHTHRKEQATAAFGAGTIGNFTDCYFIDLAGQALHGDHAAINLTRCLVQRLITVGQFNGGNVNVVESALVEFPVNDGIFADDDNDGIYFTEGSHRLTDSVIGWAKDDGVDAGSGSAGDVTVTRCWFEACYHEAMAWSGEVRDADVYDSVALNSGQGIEAGWSGGSQSAAGNDPSPEVVVERSLCIGNHVGLRFGDNYDWSYWGQLTVSDSVSIHNDRDVWGREWDSWNYRDERMDMQRNFVNQTDSRHPGNSAWDPAANAALLTPFMPTSVTAVGVGILAWEYQKDMSEYGGEVVIGLSEFTPVAVSVDYQITGDPVAGSPVVLASGTVPFAAGAVREKLALPDLAGASYKWIRVSVSNPVGCEITTPRSLFYIAPDAPVGAPVTLIATGAASIWKYLDDGSDQGTAWRERNFDDSTWDSGGAELGYGDGDELTVLQSGPAADVFQTCYFRQAFTVANPSDYSTLDLRLLRDDGAVVYINGVEVMRSGMAAGTVAFDDYANVITSGGNEELFYPGSASATVLRSGVNVVAVEVHQANATSSDVSLDFELIANRAQQPVFLLVEEDEGFTLLWQGDGWELQTSDDLAGEWTTMSGAVSPMPVKPAESAKTRRFFRLAR